MVRISGIKMNQFLITIRCYSPSSSPSAVDMECEERTGFAKLVNIGPTVSFYNHDHNYKSATLSSDYVEFSQIRHNDFSAFAHITISSYRLANALQCEQVFINNMPLKACLDYANVVSPYLRIMPISAWVRKIQMIGRCLRATYNLFCPFRLSYGRKPKILQLFMWSLSDVAVIWSNIVAVSISDRKRGFMLWTVSTPSPLMPRTNKIHPHSSIHPCV